MPSSSSTSLSYSSLSARRWQQLPIRYVVVSSASLPRCGEGPPKGRRQEGFDAVPLALVFRLPLVDDDVAVSRPMRDGARARPRGACFGLKPCARNGYRQKTICNIRQALLCMNLHSGPITGRAH